MSKRSAADLENSENISQHVKKIIFEKIPEDKNLSLEPCPDVRQIYYDHWKKQIELFWTNDQVLDPQLPTDKKHWEILEKQCPEIIELLTNILLFFKCSDIFAGDISVGVILPHADNVWVSAMFSQHAAMEVMHNQSYAKLINNRYKNVEEIEKLEKEALNKPSIAKMISWAQEYVDRGMEKGKFEAKDQEDPYYLPKLLVRFVCFEGIFFTGWFAVIYALKGKGYFPALTSANEYISRDEWRHVLNTVVLYNGLSSKMPQEVVYDLFRSAVKIAQEFIYDGMSTDLAEFNLKRSDLCEYIELVANIILDGMEYEPLFPNATLKLDFMKNKDLPTFASIHESRDTNYRNAVSNGKEVDPWAD